MKCNEIMTLNPINNLTNDDMIISSFMWSCDYCPSCDLVFCSSEIQTEEAMQTIDEHHIYNALYLNQKSLRRNNAKG